MTEITKITKLVIQPYSTTELAPFFNSKPRSFRRELAKVKTKFGNRVGHKWSIRQVEMIFAEFGRPYELIEPVRIETIHL
jgi:hypothetical protein